MKLFSELIAAVQSDLTIGDESTLFPRDTVKLSIQRAYEKAKNLHDWPQTDDAQVFETEVNREYYPFPENWVLNSAWKLQVADEVYGDKDGSPLGFKDYMYEKENNYPSGLQKIWSVYGDKIFIAPVPADIKQAMIWGTKDIDNLTEDDDETLFSRTQEDCNEAIVLEAVAILKTKGDEGTAIRNTRAFIQGSLLLSIEAKQILDNSWQDVQLKKAKYDRTLPFFDVPDFFPDKAKITKSKIGNF